MLEFLNLQVIFVLCLLHMLTSLSQETLCTFIYSLEISVGLLVHCMLNQLFSNLLFNYHDHVWQFRVILILIHYQENVQEDRDDPTQPLVTAPFGHASQVFVDM